MLQVPDLDAPSWQRCTDSRPSDANVTEGADPSAQDLQPATHSDDLLAAIFAVPQTPALRNTKTVKLSGLLDRELLDRLCHEHGVWASYYVRVEADYVRVKAVDGPLVPEPL